MTITINLYNWQDIWYLASTLALVVSGVFAFVQWIKHKNVERAELEQKLIEKVNDDEIISTVMNIIDWEEGLEYDGKFIIVNDKDKKVVLKDVELSIDKTLAHYSFICYLLKQRLFKTADIIPFEYDLKRILNNTHIRNYLFSIYHFSKKNKSKCSFHYLINYGLKKGFLCEEFKNEETKCFTNFLK